MSPKDYVADVDRLADVFHRFNFLKVTEEVESNHSSLLSHVYLGWIVNWVDV